MGDLAEMGFLNLGPQNKDDSILGSILESSYLEKLPNISILWKKHTNARYGLCSQGRARKPSLHDQEQLAPGRSMELQGGVIRPVYPKP